MNLNSLFDRTAAKLHSSFTDTQRIYVNGQVLKQQSSSHYELILDSEDGMYARVHPIVNRQETILLDGVSESSRVYRIELLGKASTAPNLAALIDENATWTIVEEDGVAAKPCRVIPPINMDYQGQGWRIIIEVLPQRS